MASNGAGEMDYKYKPTGPPEILTDEMKEKVKKCLTASLSIQGTCRVIGISKSTWYLWKSKADAYNDKKLNRRKVDDNDLKYVEFFDMVHSALGDAELKLVLDIQSDKSWQSKHTILKRRFNNDWGEKQELNINQNSTVNHDFSSLSDDQIEEQLKRIAENKNDD